VNSPHIELNSRYKPQKRPILRYFSVVFEQSTKKRMPVSWRPFGKNSENILIFLNEFSNKSLLNLRFCDLKRKYILMIDKFHFEIGLPQVKGI